MLSYNVLVISKKRKRGVIMATAKKKIDMIPRDSDKEAKKKALNTAIAQLEKDFGQGTIMKLGENTRMNVQAVSTGSIALDVALGIGGVPRGRIIEIYGAPSVSLESNTRQCPAALVVPVLPPIIFTFVGA